MAAQAGRIPSAGFGLAYLITIPIFAVFYFALPADFYHAAAKYDTTVIAEANASAKRLEQIYLADNGDTLRRLGKGPPRFKIHLESDRVEVLVVGRMVKQPARSETWSGTAALEISNAMIEMPIFKGDWQNAPVDVLATPRKITGYDVDFSSLFPCRKAEGTCLRMTPDDYLALGAFAEIGAGRITEAQNSYARMLYFSAVTITTLGYGDIVPVTSRTRALVTIEIILGPLLFGLFLNSLVREGAAVKRG